MSPGPPDLAARVTSAVRPLNPKSLIPDRSHSGLSPGRDSLHHLSGRRLRRTLPILTFCCWPSAGTLRADIIYRRWPLRDKLSYHKKLVLCPQRQYMINSESLLKENSADNKGFDIMEKNSANKGFDIMEKNSANKGFDIMEKNSANKGFDIIENNSADNKGFDMDPVFPSKQPPDANGVVAPAARDIPMSKFRIYKNVLVLSFGFMFLFTAFQSMANLQTSLNKEYGVGAWSLSAIYAALIVSCMFLPKFIIARLGCKWTVPVCMIGYALYMGANFYAVIWLMTVAGVILGFGAAPMWSAKCTYLTQIGLWYAKMTKQSEDAVINVFFGFFFMMFQTSQIWGNLISSSVFSSKPENYSDIINRTAEELAICGANFCPSNAINNPSFDQPKEKVYIVCGIYLGCAVVAMIIVSLFLDPITLDQETSAADRRLSPKLLISTFKHLFSSPAQFLLIPLTVYSGVEQAFVGGDFTKSFVSCTLGIWNIGYVMICYGVTDALCSFLFGRLVQYVGHIPFFILATLVHGGLQIAMLLWEPTQDQVVIFYIIAGLWGMGDAVIQTQINALYGALFTENTEAAFANYRLWESVGFVMTYGYNDYLCTSTKLYVCLGFLGSGMVCYTLVEIIERRKKSKAADITVADK